MSMPIYNNRPITNVVIESYKKETVENPEEQRLAEAVTLFSTLWEAPAQVDKFVSITSEKERLVIIRSFMSLLFLTRDLAKIEEMNGWIRHFSDDIESYKFSEKGRVELIKILAVPDCLEELLPQIAKFNVTDQTNLIDLATFLADVRPRLLSECIRDFGIKDEKERLKIALKVASRSNGDIHETIDSYELSEKDRTLVAKTQAMHYDYLPIDDPNEVLIDCFTLEEESNRFEVAKAVMSRSSHCCKYIDCYDLNEEHRIQIAQELARTRPLVISNQIQYFSISDEKILAAIAKKVAGNRAFSSRVFCDFQNFNISSPALRLEILQIALSNMSDGELINIEDNLVNKFAEPERVEIAKILASRNEEFRIAPLRIKSESNRIAIAKIFARRFGYNLSIQLGDFKIKDTRVLLDLCNIATKGKMGRELCDVLNGFMDHLEHSLKFPQLEQEIEALASGDEVLHENLMVWLTYYEWACDAARLLDKTCTAQHIYASQILKHEDPISRISLLSVLFKYGPPQKSFGKDHLLLFHMLLTPLSKFAGLSGQESEQIWNILKHKDFYDSAKQEKVIKGLTSLLLCDDLADKDKGIILRHIFRNKDNVQNEPQQKTGAEKKDVITDLQMLHAILSSHNTEVLKIGQPDQKEADEKEKTGAAAAGTLKQPIDLEAAVNHIFTQVIGIESIPEFSKKYAATIGMARNPMALLIYATQLGSLPIGEFKEVQRSLKEFVITVLSGEKAYQVWRYQTNTFFFHLNQIFKSKPNLKDKWVVGEKLSLAELNKIIAEENLKVEAQATHKEFDLVRYLKVRICDDKHTAPEKFPRLEECLRDPSKCKEALIAISLERKQDKLSKTEKYDPTNPKTKPLFLRQLEGALINLLIPTTPVVKKVADIQEFVLPLLIKIYGANSIIVRDIQNLQKHLQAGVQSEKNADIEKKYIVEDTDKWEDMLLCGTEVAGSCQKISGSPTLNKCLVGYLADGKNRAIVIKDAKTGQMVARCIMRLLWDNKIEQPVIFQERLYHNPGVPQEALQAIDAMFVHRARQFALPLVRTVVNDDEVNYPNELVSIDSPAPFEYVDAGALGTTDGRFTIPAKYIRRVPI